MKKHRSGWQSVLCMVIIVITIASCNSTGEMASRPTTTGVEKPSETRPPTVTLTTIPTETLLPTPTSPATATPMPTPTPRVPLSDENVQQWEIFQTLGGVTGVDIAFSLDGEIVAIANQNGIVFYDSRSLQIQKTIQTDHPVDGLLVSPGGDSLLAMDDQENVFRYQLPSGDLLDGPMQLDQVTDFCTQGNGLSSFGPWWARLYCLPDQAARITTDPYVEGMITIAFNTDATLAMLGGQYGFELVNLDGDQIKNKLWNTTQWSGYFTGQTAAFSPDGQVVALGFNDGMVYLLDINSGKQLATYTIGGDVQGLTYSKDGTLLAAISDTGAKIIRVESGLAKEIGGVSPGYVNDMAISPDGQKILTASDVNQFMLWDIASGSVIYQWDGSPFEKHHDYPNYACILWGGQVAYSPDGQFLALGDNGSVRIINAHTGKALDQLRVGKVLSLSFSPDSRRIAVATSDFKAGQDQLADGIQLWDIASAKLVQTMAGNVGFSGNKSYNCTHHLAFSADGQILITTGEDVVTLWDITTGQQVQKSFVPKLNEIQGMAFAPGGHVLAVTGRESVIKFWKVEGHEISSLAVGIIPIKSWYVGFDPSGQILAAGSRDSDLQFVNILNVADQKLLRSIQLIQFPTGITPVVAFSPMGDVLAVSTGGRVFFYAVQP